jgi:hypothetical protein
MDSGANFHVPRRRRSMHRGSRIRPVGPTPRALEFTIPANNLEFTIPHLPLKRQATFPLPGLIPSFTRAGGSGIAWARMTEKLIAVLPARKFQKRYLKSQSRPRGYRLKKSSICSRKRNERGKSAGEGQIKSHSICLSKKRGRWDAGCVSFVCVPPLAEHCIRTYLSGMG